MDLPRVALGDHHVNVVIVEHDSLVHVRPQKRAACDPVVHVGILQRQCNAQREAFQLITVIFHVADHRV